MASSAEDQRHEGHPTNQSHAEDQPLLGGPGDAIQDEETPMWKNLFQGTAVIAQGGIIILTLIVWASVLTKDVILFSAHPLLNSAGLLFLTEAILILQPTSTPTQKKNGAYIHATLNDLAVLSLLAGLIVILYNKIAHAGSHFESPHAILGLIVYILVAFQAVVGATALFTPKLYGSVSRAKSLYKYHRVSGYVILTAMLATVATATTTDFNVNVLKMNLWAVVVVGVIVLVGVVPRVRLSKLGLK